MTGSTCEGTTESTGSEAGEDSSEVGVEITGRDAADDDGVDDDGTKGSCFGRNAELISPIPTKKSSIMCVVCWCNDGNKLQRGGDYSQGTTLTKFSHHSHTSPRSSMITTMLVSTGNSRLSDLKFMFPLSSRERTREPNISLFGSRVFKTDAAYEWVPIV